MAQALQLHKPGDKFMIVGIHLIAEVQKVYISESGKILYKANHGLFTPEQCDWITTEVE